jgi:proteasome assembly chaperone (PAC2) family protein
MADTSTYLRQHDDIELRDPVLVAAFRGWNDAGDAASFAALHLGRIWSATRLASIEPEEFYDFQATRPQVRLEDGKTRNITWPSNELWGARLENTPHDALILVGTEPNLKWQTFSRLIVDLAVRYEVRLAITLGALLADVPHSRPVQITGTAVADDLVERLGLQRSRYEGPTGIVGVVHDALQRSGVQSASLWAAVPHYLAVSPNPKAAMALVERSASLIGTSVELDDLRAATAAYEDRVSEMVAADDDVRAYVRLLEDRVDEAERESPIDPSSLPSGDALAQEFERFLRERNQGDG